jgi:hypothetical protein
MRFSSPLLIFGGLLVGTAGAPCPASAAGPALGHEIAAAIENQLVVTAASLSVDPVSPPAGIAFAPVAPNPASGVVTLRFTLPQTASVALAIFDPAGRRIREVTSGQASEGEHSLKKGAQPWPRSIW